jgi:hypothetical protein
MRTKFSCRPASGQRRIRETIASRRYSLPLLTALVVLFATACNTTGEPGSSQGPTEGSSRAFVSSGTAFPLTASSSGRYLVDQNGTPFRVQADTSWDAHLNLGLSDLRTYLDDRKSKGFNALFTYVSNPVAYFVGSVAPYAAQLGGKSAGAAALPFTQNASGGTWDGDPNFTNHDANFASPNDAYYAWVAQFVDEAASRGMVVLLAPMYLGYNGGGQDGWFETLTNSVNTQAVCNGYGQYLANGHGSFTGFKSRPNIIWVNGGDSLPANGSEGAQRVLQVIKGMQSAGDTHIQTAHWQHDYLPWDQTDIGPYLTAYSSYTHGPYPSLGPTYAQARLLYAHSPARPSWLLETSYWGEHGGTRGQTRYLSWGSVLSAIDGATLGFGPFWGFVTSPDGVSGTGGQETTAWTANTAYALDNYVSRGGNWYRATTGGTSGSTAPSGSGGNIQDGSVVWAFAASGGWQALLNEPAVLDFKVMGAFLDGLPWYNLVPSGLSGTKTLITSGGGTYTSFTDGGGASGGMDWIVSAATPDGRLLVAYVPPAHNGAFTVDMTAMSGSARARWFDPASATYTTIGNYPNTGTQTFTVPGTNSAGSTDWVLILDPSSTSAPPTVATAASASPSTVTGNTTNLSVLGADDGGEASLTYTWAATGTPPASVSFSANGTNSSKNATATFRAAGTYTLQATIADTQGQTVTSAMTVRVNQVLTRASVSPSNASVAPASTTQFTAIGTDQFGSNLSSQPAFSWTVNGGGSISASGVFTASSPTGGPYTITATSGSTSATASVSVGSSGFAAKVNFQLSTTATPSGYLPDSGSVYGDRGNGYTYGWNADTTAEMRERNASNSPDKRYDTLGQLQRPEAPNRVWEIAVPNGTYSVRVVAGDPSYTDSVYALDVEGTLTISGTPTTSHLFFDNTVTVTVNDGRLTVDNGSGSSNDKINFIEITSAAKTPAVVPANQAPTVATAAAASPNPVTVTTTSLSVLGADDGGEGSLTYTWATTGTPPAAVTFSPNATNAAKASTATFSKAGTYGFVVTITDASNATVTSSVNVTVNATVSSVTVTPGSVSTATSASQQFTASGTDQFGATLAPQPAFAWAVSGGGTMSSGGVFTAGTSAGGPYAVTASSGGKSGTANVTVTSSQITMGEMSVLTSTDSNNANYLCVQSATLSKTATLQSVTVYVAAASGTLRLGVYDATGPGGGPGALVAQTNQFTPGSGWNTQNVTTPLSLAPGTYWLTYLPDSDSLQTRIASSGTDAWRPYSAAPLPSTFGTEQGSSSVHWSIYATLSGN